MRFEKARKEAPIVISQRSRPSVCSLIETGGAASNMQTRHVFLPAHTHNKATHTCKTAALCIVRVGRNLTWPRLAAGFCRFRYSRYSSRSQQASPRAASMCVGRILRLSPCQVNGRCPGRVFLGLGAFFLGAGNGCIFATLPYHNIGTQAHSTRCFPPLCPFPVR